MNKPDKKRFHKPAERPKPPCANWDIWIGPEVEGTSDLSVRTLFIRKLPEALAVQPDIGSFLRTKSKADRLWLTKEMMSWASSTAKWDAIRALVKSFAKTCVEIEAKCLMSIPKDIQEAVTIYMKVAQLLKPGDFVCVGEAFYDEAFEIGKGKSVDMKDYLNDIKIV